ncbi:Fungal specific transcription factor domain-containing protein [Cladophialophora immunda]|nr:Fungal specific transcription factor domain-containing protein [Cladophialophora immunda]
MDFTCVYSRIARIESHAVADQGTPSHLELRLSAMEETLRLLTSKSNAGGKTTDSDALLPRTQGLISPQNSGNASWEPDRDLMAAPSDSRSISSDIIVTPKPDNRPSDTVDGMVLITFAGESSSAFFGPSSNSAFFADIDASLRRLRPLATQPSTANATHGFHDTSFSRPPSVNRHRRADGICLEDANCFLLPPRATVLRYIDTFFSGFGMLFPYLSPKDFRDAFTKAGNSALSGVRRSWLCLLNTMMAFATSEAVSFPQEKTDAEMFLQRALKLLPDIALQPANLETLQALLLMLQFLQGTQHSARTWTVQGLCTQAAFQIGLHSPSERTKHNPREQEIMKRCWHMCYIMDKTCAMTFGRPQTIPEELQRISLPVDVDLDVLDDGDSPSQSSMYMRKSSSVAAFIESVKIYAIVGKILERVYQNNVKTEERPPSSFLFNQIMSLEVELARWKSAIPSPLRVLSQDEVRLAAANRNSADDIAISLILTLRYLHTRLLLHRPMATSFLGLDVLDDGHGKKDDFLQQFGQSSLECCLSSALEMIALLSVASDQGYQFRPSTTWWFQIYYAFSSALVVFAVIVINRRYGMQISGLENRILLSNIQDTVKILETLGPGSDIGNRCRRYLGKVHQCSLLLLNDAADHGSLNNLGTVTAHGLSELDFFDLSPSDWMNGQFVAEADLGNFLQPPINSRRTWL